MLPLLTSAFYLSVGWSGNWSGSNP